MTEAKKVITKPLFILVSNGGDGSYSTCFVLDQAVIDMMKEAYNHDLLDCESCPGIDGDGFHYDTINVPENFTANDLGISVYDMNDVISMLKERDVDVQDFFRKMNKT